MQMMMFTSFCMGTNLESTCVIRLTPRARASLDVAQQVFGKCEAKSGPKLINCCKPEQVGTKEYGKMLKRIQVHEDGRVPAEEARHWKIEGQKRRTITRKEYQRVLKKFEMESFVVQKGLWNLEREKMHQDRGALPKEEGDIIRENKAMHEENFLGSLLREDGKEKEQIIMETGKDTKEDRKPARRGERRERDEGVLKEDVSVVFLWRPLISLPKGIDLESCGGLSWERPSGEA